MTWIRRAFSPADGPLLRFGLPAALILTITLLIRHGDGAIPWDTLAATCGRAPRAAFVISGALFCMAIAGLWAARPILRFISLLLPFAFALAAWVNVLSFGSTNDQDPYRLQRRQNPTMLDLADSSPSEFEHTEFALYLFIHAEYEGKAIAAYAPDLFAGHYLQHVAHVASFRIENYPHELDAASARDLEARPHVERRDGRGRIFVFLTDSAARTASSFRVMKTPEKFYLLPDASPSKPEKK
ncbi:MAG TPA: hypothetical protein VMV81_06535 [Phycisphaerae bacterium]|nr:hypothetical protein [Phycisphaerae bacterium]